MKYKANSRRRASEYEKALVEWWKKNKVFEKSVEQRSEDDSYVFYDGPPFITGMPHHGTLLSSIVKDAVPRFWTMRGKRVERRWGWDCHGLPAENFVEKQLGITDRREIDTDLPSPRISSSEPASAPSPDDKSGSVRSSALPRTSSEMTSSGKGVVKKISLEDYILKARESMVANSETWEGTIDRIGRWVDFKGAYRTMDKDFMESVWWAFKQLYEAGKIYEGRKVLMYDTKFATPVSKSEVTMDNDAYQEVTDPSAYVKFEVFDDPEGPTYFLAWTTTPWTLPANMALAVNPEMEYVTIQMKDLDEKWILAKSRVDAVLAGENYEIISECKGKDLAGIEYSGMMGEALKNVGEMVAERGKVLLGDFVSDVDGTGVVHIAPAYGEDDYKICQKNGVGFVDVLDEYGYYLPEVAEKLHELGVRDTDERGIEIWAGNKFIAKCLEEKGIVWKIEYIKHEYPFNPRSKQRIMYRAFPSWFFDVQGQKDLMIAQNENINWFPEYLKHGRFEKNIEQAPDWNLSRDRFWATAMPVWKGDKGTVKVVGSYAELKELSGVELEDYHRPWVDEIEFDLPVKTAGMRQDNLKVDKNSKILFVCNTNIGRSQMAKAIYNRLIGGENAESAGVDVDSQEGATVALRDRKLAEKMGVESYQSTAREVMLSKYGIDISDEPRVQLAPEMLAKYDLVVNIAEKQQTPDWLRGENVIWWDISDAGLIKDREEKLKASWVTVVEIEKRLQDLMAGKVIDDGIDNPVKMEHFKRIDKVLDCWFESGSMPFAQLHYPFENKEKFERNYPADFIVEYVGQVRAWFYYVHCVNTALASIGAFGQDIASSEELSQVTAENAGRATPATAGGRDDRSEGDAMLGQKLNAFKNVITTGTLAGNDGRKMSKSLGNYTDPNELMDKFSADALRFLLLSSPVLSGEDFALTDKDVSDVNRKLAMIWNVYDFFTMYAEVDGWEYQEGSFDWKKLENPLDRWIWSRAAETDLQITEGMKEYNIPKALSGVLPFVDDLSNWFVRRSRRRFWKSEDDADKEEAYQTLYMVLSGLATTLAPFTPFLAEELWQNMRGDWRPENSVHLLLNGTEESDAKRREMVDQEILEQMAQVRAVINEGLKLRMYKDEHEQQVKVRQPLAKLVYTGEELPDWGVEIVKDEVNVKEVEWGEKAWIDKEITEELGCEGLARELVRVVQGARKKAGLQVDDRIRLSVGTEIPSEWVEMVKQETLTEELVENGNFAYDEIVKLGGENVTISLEKA